MINAILRGSFRTQFLLGFLACAGLLGYALFTQFHDGLVPCPLCIFQRVAFAALGVVFLIGGLHAPTKTGGRRAYGVLALLASAAGLWIAGRHVYIQHLPEGSVPACGADLDFMLDAMPLASVIRKVMTGAGECAKIDWTFLGLSMPEWVLAWFALLAVWAGWAAFRKR